MVGKRVVILGSGDIGLIMARRMTLEGAKVLACVEVMPYSGGLNRNIVQCLQRFDIPLYLSHTITDIVGKHGRVERVVVSAVDENRTPIPGTEMAFDCDTVLLSVGLIPENELSRAAGIEIDPRTNGPVVYENMETSLPGVFAAATWCMSTIWWTLSPPRASGPAARRRTRGSRPTASADLELVRGARVNYTVPQKIRLADVEKRREVFFRVNKVQSARSPSR